MQNSLSFCILGKASPLATSGNRHSALLRESVQGLSSSGLISLDLDASIFKSGT